MPVADIAFVDILLNDHTETTVTREDKSTIHLLIGETFIEFGGENTAENAMAWIETSAPGILDKYENDLSEFNAYFNRTFGFLAHIYGVPGY